VRSSALVLGCALALGSIALAQERQPTEAEVENAKDSYRQPTEAEVEAARRTYREPAQAALDAASQAPIHMDAVPMPKGRIDVEGLARRFEAARQVLTEEPRYAAGEPALLVFVTLGMPEPALKMLAGQAARAGAVLLLRGLEDGSIRRTAAHVRQLMGHKPVSWQIDPQAFDRFGIAQAPAFVLVKADTQQSGCAGRSCAAPGTYVAVVGDVSLAYALEAIARRAPGFALETRLFLDRMRP
jgi:conjugal transfer pilus assembly protein TrbC